MGWATVTVSMKELPGVVAHVGDMTARLVGPFTDEKRKSELPDALITAGEVSKST